LPKEFAAPGAAILVMRIALHAAFISALVPGWAPYLEVSTANRAAAQQTRRAPDKSSQPAAPVTIDYPEEGSIFPPEIIPPTFLWRDPQKASTVWRIDVSFADASAGIHLISHGERMRIGKIDPDCAAETNELPKLTPQQASAHTWRPDPAAWAFIKKHSVAGAATVTIAGLPNAKAGQAISRGRVTIYASKDPVGAPIFYRDVPLMPSELRKGVIKPLAAAAVPLIAWRLRNLGEPRSRVVMDNVPVCANCHSFSADGKTLGMDLDGLHGNRGMYFLARVMPQTSVGNEDLIQWTSAKGRLENSIRVGFMSQVSPDGQYVVTTTNPAEAAVSQQPPQRAAGARQPASAVNAQNPPSNYYVANFKDYRFLQVFYPTRWILSWYSRTTGLLQPLPGADDPRFAQMGGVWSPDGKYLVFARAEAKEPYPPGTPLAEFANDPNETQIQYDLYRIPFNQGRGGEPQPIAGASHNGMSNTFPKVSPDGRWIVFVECRNGQLMRPDSQLYIVPAAGGQAQRMRCNTRRMNSWHSFSPNGRWLVFSSKSRSPYTQMYLTHVDPEGNDSPAILIEDATAANRAVNIPEFVNVAPDGLRSIGGPAIEYYKLINRAVYLQKRGRYEESIAQWRKVLELGQDEEMAHSNLGSLLLLTGHRDEAGMHLRKAAEMKLRKALETDAGSAPSHNSLGRVLLESGRVDDAMAQWQKALEIKPDYAQAHAGLGDALYARGKIAGALAHWRDAIRLRSNDLATVQKAAWVLATCPDASIRNGGEALALAVRAVGLSGQNDPQTLDTLAAAYAEAGQFEAAAETARRALALAAPENQQQAEALKARIALYEANKPFRERHRGSPGPSP
jgi:tetratricopeptide (TPR) repeat protein